MQTNTVGNNPYFANLEEDRIGKALVGKREIFERYVRQSGLFELWRKAYSFYHSRDSSGFTAHSVGRTGPKSQFSVLQLNHFRSIVKRWRTLAMAQRVALKPVVKFSGYGSEIQAKKAKAILDNDMNLGLERHIGDGVEIAAVLGAGHLRQFWNPSIGDMVIPAIEDGAPPIRSGDVETHIFTPLDVIQDPIAKSPDQPWLILRYPKNKYDLAARYAKGNTALEEKIVTLGREKLEISFDWTIMGVSEDATLSDEVWVYEFWHQRTEACPNGRLAVYCTGDVILELSDLGKLDKIPVRRIAPANVLRSPWGYSDAWDLLAPQEAINTLSSIQLSNAKAFGGGVYIAPKNCGFESTDLGAGQKLLQYNPGMQEPKPLQPPVTPAEVGVNRKLWVNEMGTLIGVNSVNRGDPEASLESGSALALVQAQGVEASKDFQTSIREFEEGVGDDRIALRQKFMTTAAMIPIIGEQLASMEEVDSESINEVIRVRAEQINPLSQTLAGRTMLADSVAEKFPNSIDPAQYMRLLATGEWEPLEGPAQEQRNIDRENELLSRGIGPPPKQPVIDQMTGQPAIDPATGQPAMERKGQDGQLYVRAIIADNPIRHILGHRKVLDSVQARANPQVVQAVLEHMDEHEELYALATVKRPGLLQALGIPPLQSAAMELQQGGPGPRPPQGAPNPAGGAPGAHPQPPPPPAGAAGRINAPGKPDLAPPRPGQAPKQPLYPTNPSSGDRYHPSVDNQ